MSALDNGYVRTLHGRIPEGIAGKASSGTGQDTRQSWREVAFWMGVVSFLTVGGVVVGSLLPVRYDPPPATEFLKAPGPRAPM